MRWAMLVILLVAAGFRLWDLPITPPGLHNDEAFAGLDAVSVLRQGPRIFFEANTGNEPLYTHLLAVSVAVLGRTSYALRLPAALISIATVAVTFALARIMFQQLGRVSADRIALLSAAFLAVSHWQVDINRLALRVNTMPLILGIALFLLWRAARRGTGYGWAGLLFGAVGYTYISARILPAFGLTFGLAELMLRPRDRAFASRRAFGIWAGVAAIVVAPLAIYYATHLDLFLGRATYVSVAGPYAQNDRVLALTESLVGNLAMFGQEGDDNWRHNLPGKPVFDAPTYLLFLGGLGICLWRIRSGPHLQLLVWVAAMLLPGIIAIEGYPHYTRTMGIVPGVFMLPAIGADGLMRLAERMRRAPLPAAWAAIPAALLIAWTGATTARDYFGDWASKSDVYFAFNSERVDAARAMNRLGSQPDTVFLAPYNFRLDGNFGYQIFDLIYQGAAPYRFVKVEEATLPAALPSLVGTARDVYLFQWKGGEYADADPKGLLPFLLSRAGEPTIVEDTQGYRLTRFPIDRPVSPEMVGTEQLVGRRIAPGLVVEGVTVPAQSDGRLPVVVRWRAAGDIADDSTMSLQLIDVNGQRYAQADQLLRSNDLFPTSEWPVDLPAISYAVLEGPPGAPPGTYRLRLTVYSQESGRVAGSIDSLAEVRIDGTTRSVASRWIDRPANGPMLGAWVGPRPVRPGDTVAIETYWKGAAGPIVARLTDSSRTIIAEVTVPAGATNGIERVILPLRIVAGAVAGPTTLTMTRAAGALIVVDGPIVEDRPRRFDLPSVSQPRDDRFSANVRLAGTIEEDGCSASPRAGCELRFSLVWQAAGSSDRDWTAFVHLADASGKPIAQTDAPPGGDTATFGWRDGEVFVQQVRLRVPNDAAGDFRLIVGLYDAEGRRATVAGGESVVLRSVAVSQ